VRVRVEDPLDGDLLAVNVAGQVAVTPDCSSKSSTGSTTVQRQLAESATTHCTLKVRGSKNPATSGLSLFPTGMASIGVPYAASANWRSRWPMSNSLPFSIMFQ
jgi:hypothetical protein